MWFQEQKKRFYQPDENNVSDYQLRCRLYMKSIEYMEYLNWFILSMWLSVGQLTDPLAIQLTHKFKNLKILDP